MAGGDLTVSVIARSKMWVLKGDRDAKRVHTPYKMEKRTNK